MNTTTTNTNNTNANKRSGSLLQWPDNRWEAWKTMPRMANKAVPRTKFWLLKAPLSTVYEEQFGGDRFQFQVSMFVQRMTSKNIAVGLAVDCTALDRHIFENNNNVVVAAHQSLNNQNENVRNSCRYFHNAEEWDDFDVDYSRLTKDDNDDIVPSEATVQKFIGLVSAHMLNRPKTYVALFDSFGGYGAAAFLAASYMIAQMRAPVNVAIASIREAIPDGIFHPLFLSTLQKRYQGKKETKVPKPPAWYFKLENDPFTQTTIAPFKPSTMMMPPPKRVKVVGDFKGSTSAGASIEVVDQKCRFQVLVRGNAKYERAVAVLQQLTGMKSDFTELPIVHSSILNKTVLEENFDKSFLVTWNAKGKRGLLLLLSDGVFFFRTKKEGGFEVLLIPGMWFPCPRDPSKPQHRTLLDGVLVEDKEAGANTGAKSVMRVMRFLVFDALTHSGGSLLKKPLSERLKFASQGVIAIKKQAQPNSIHEPMRIRMKDYFTIDKTSYLLKSFIPQVTHECDGLIFARKDVPYYDMHIYKWHDVKDGVSKDDLIKKCA